MKKYSFKLPSLRSLVPNFQRSAAKRKIVRNFAIKLDTRRFGTLRFPLRLPRRLRSRKALLIATCFLLIVTPTLFILARNANKTAAAWWDDTWGYRKTIAISNSYGSTLTNFQVKALTNINLTTDITAGKIKGDLGDLRFTDINGKQLPYWIEDTTTSSVDIWVLIPSVPTTGATIYMYYGNPSAVNPNNVTGMTTGGTITTTSGYRIHTFINNGTFTAGPITTAETLVVAGGGGGGSSQSSYGGGGGGGGGGLIYNASTSINGDPYNITIGTGGPPGTTGSSQPGSNGDNSSFGTLITAIGGGGGATNFADGNSGGSGGGAGWNGYSTVRYGGSATSGQGNTGGNTSQLSWAGGAGGGGAGGVGGDNKINHGGGDGGAGSAYSISGSSVTYAGGGGGGSNNPGPSSPNSGDGGDAAYAAATAYAGANGIVIIKYAVPTEPSAASPTNEEQSQAPVAYWKFDEGYGSTANDSTKNANNGTITNATWTDESMCISGKCLEFNGSNSIITTSNIANLDSGMTVTGWINVKSQPGYYSSMVASSTSGFVLNFNNTGDGAMDAVAQIYNGSGWTAINCATNSNFNKWYQLSLTYDDATTTAKVYLNGIKCSSDVNISGGMNSAYTKAINIGGYAGNYHDGFIDDVKIYPYARTAAQIKTDYKSRGSTKGVSANLGASTSNSEALSEGLVGYWKMDEASGNALDSSGNSWTLTNTGPASYIGGKFGNTPSFTGTQYFGNASCTAFSVTDNFSWGGWVYIDSASPASRAILRSEYHHLSTNSAGKYVYYIHDVSWYPFTSTGSYATNAWQHIFVSYSNRTVKIYINGQLDSTQTHSNGDGLADGTNNCGIGYAGGWNNFVGKIDEVRAYNRSLSPTEIRNLYAWAPGPVGYWNFDEATGTNLYDRSGNGNNSTSFAGSPSWVSGKFGKALEFNGTDDRVSIPSISATYGENPVFTAEFWVKPGVNAYGWYKGILGTNSSAWNVMYLYSATNFRYNTHHSTDLGASYSWTIVNKGNSWQHFAITFDKPNNQAILYQDGIYMGTLAISKRITGPFSYIGGQTGGAEYFNGAIDDVRIYNYIRTPGQIVEDMNAGHPIGGSPIASQLGYWKFDEGYGTTANNSGFGGSALNGTFGASAAAPSWSNSGKFGKALTFTAANNTVVRTPITTTNGLNIRGAITYSAWFKRNTNTGYQTLIDMLDNCGSVAGDGYLLRFDNSNLQFSGIIDDTVGINPFSLSYTNANTTGDTTNWHHVVTTWDGTTNTNGVKMYMDGIRVAQTTANADASLMASLSGFNLSIGTLTCNTHSFNGLIDEVKIYNSTLTAEEILLDYNHGSAMVLGSTSTTSTGAPDNSASGQYCVPGSSDPCSPPVLEWKFDEKIGSATYDTSGNNNTGTLYNMEADDWRSSAQCIHGGCINIDETSTESVQAAHSAELNPASLTVEGWFYLRNRSDRHIVITKWNGYSLEINSSGYPYLRLTGLSPVDLYSTQAVSWNQWHYIAASFDGSTNIRKVYIDGKEIISDTPTGTISYASNPFRVGYTGNYMDGLADDVRVYDYVRTTSQIAWDYNRGGPVGHWKLDECQGTVANDSSGNGNTGTITIGATGTNTSAGTCTGSAGQAWKDGAIGKYNSSLEFDGTDDVVSVANNTNINPTSGITATAWFKTTDTTGGIAVKRSVNNGYRIVYASGILYFTVGNGTAIVQPNIAGYNDGNWHHVVGTWSDSDDYAYLYVDGILKDTKTISGPMTNTATALLIGNSDDQGYLNGQIDDVRIYNYALTATQIKTLFNENSAIRFGP